MRFWVFFFLSRRFNVSFPPGSIKTSTK